MALVEQISIRAAIPSSQEIQELQNSVMKIEDLAERQKIARDKLKKAGLTSRGGIFSPNESDTALSSLTEKGKTSSIAQAKRGTQLAMGSIGNIQGTIFTQMMGAASKLFPATFILSIATTVFALIVAQFGSGGLFDIRKKELDSVKSLIGLERETDIIGGDTLFLGNPTLVQGVAKNQTSNTENLRDGQRRFVLRNNGY